MNTGIKYFVRIENDSDCENPCDYDGAWKIYSFSHRHINYRDPSDFLLPSGKPRIEFASKFRHGLAFPLQYFEHGLCRWDISGHGPQCPWDSVRFAGVAVWEESPANIGAKSIEDRQADCQRQLDAYSDWCNGHCFYFSIECNDETIDSCGGFIGDDVLMGIRESLPRDATEENTSFSGDGDYLASGFFHKAMA